jgi:hypothetical protein
VDEAIDRFGCGVSLRPGQSDLVVEFLRVLMRNRERRDELRRHARKAFEDAYCDRQAFPPFDEVFAQVCADDESK